MKNIKIITTVLVMCLAFVAKAQQGPMPKGYGNLTFVESKYVKEKDGYFDIWKKPNGEMIYNRFRVWGNGICQEPSKAVNYKNKAEYISFMRNGTPLQKNDGRLYDGLSYGEYLKYLPTMQKQHNISMLSFYNKLNIETGGAFAKMFTLKGFYDIEDVIKVFESSFVFYGNAPTGVSIPFDGVDITNSGIFSLGRTAHVLSGGEAEGGWWIDLTEIGYEPIFSASAFCFNTPDAEWIKPNLVKLPTAEEKPQPTPIIIECKKTPIVIPCTPSATPAPIVIGCTKTPIIINGTGSTATKTPIVINSSSTSTATTGPNSNDYNF